MLDEAGCKFIMKLQKLVHFLYTFALINYFHIELRRHFLSQNYGQNYYDEIVFMKIENIMWSYSEWNTNFCLYIFVFLNKSSKKWLQYFPNFGDCFRYEIIKTLEYITVNSHSPNRWTFIILQCSKIGWLWLLRPF